MENGRDYTLTSVNDEVKVSSRFLHKTIEIYI